MGVRFDMERRRSTGEPFALTHYDSPRLAIAGNLATMELGVGERRALLTRRNTTSNIWMLDNVDK